VTPSRAFSLKFHLTPWVVAALLLRAAMPMGPMDITLSAAMCSSQGLSETLEIPGSPHPVHCDACVIPAPAMPPALAQLPDFLYTAPEIVITIPDAPIDRFALHRAQIPRAPPLA
jgi:hypothetical protein